MVRMAGPTRDASCVAGKSRARPPSGRHRPPITSSAAPASALCGSPTIRHRASRSTPPARKKALAMASTHDARPGETHRPENAGPVGRCLAQCRRPRPEEPHEQCCPENETDGPASAVLCPDHGEKVASCERRPVEWPIVGSSNWSELTMSQRISSDSSAKFGAGTAGFRNAVCQGLDIIRGHSPARRSRPTYVRICQVTDESGRRHPGPSPWTLRRVMRPRPPRGCGRPARPWASLCTATAASGFGASIRQNTLPWPRRPSSCGSRRRTCPGR